ncbi:MAG: hypothetical protein AB9866_19070 [Syntrophobacteraceae bacterium]
MSQLFSFEGMWLNLDQINEIKAKREEKSVKKEEELTRPEMMKLLKEKGIPFTAKMKNDELKQLLN